MKLDFIPLDYSSFDFAGKNYLLLIGRNAQGKRIAVIDKYDANFWAVFTDGLSAGKMNEIKKKIECISVENASRKTKVEKTELHEKMFLGKPVKALQIFVTNHKDAHAVADELGMPEIEKRREYDISLIAKYIKEKKVLPGNWYSVSGEIASGFGLENLDVDICISASKIERIPDKEFKPKVLAFDIETSEYEIGKGNVLMVSLYGENFKKVLTWKKCAIKQDFVECFVGEEEMLEKFCEYIKEYAPDFLVGYYSDGFDLPYLRAVANKHKLKLNLGVDGSQLTFSRGKISSGEILGIIHVDLYRFIDTAYSQYMQSEIMSLNEVAGELLGEKKHEFDFAKMKKMNEGDWKDFFAYNLQDSYLTYKLFEKFWPDLVEFSRLCQEPIFDVTRNSISTNVESFILANLDRFNEIAEKRPVYEEIGKRKMLGKYEGAFVFQPSPGLYENICVFDFTAMYSSMIASYNLSLTTLLEKKEKGSYEVNLGESKVYFSSEKGFFPTLIEELIEKRKEYKKEYNKNPNPILKARSNAFKLLANAAYGYQGFFGARYYCREAAAATAAMARKNILEAIEKIKKTNEVIYSDTDSIIFIYKDKEKTLKLLEKINSELPGIVELELEGFFSRGLFVMKRSGGEGAKKKYALMDEKGKIKIRGFETVRRDWCKLARNLQNSVLEKVLEDGNEKAALKLVKEMVEKIKKRKIDKKELIIRTQLRKEIEEYKSVTPHVIAARKMQEAGIPLSQDLLIEYFIAETPGKKLVRDMVALPDEDKKYDEDYYLDKQVLPAVENILEVFGINIKEVIEGKKQTTLF